jgi:SAM-dependent methyltransferase
MNQMVVRMSKAENRRCPLCDSERSRLLFSDTNRREGLSIVSTVVECRICGMRYLNPAPEPDLLSRCYREGMVDPVKSEEDLLPLSSLKSPDPARASSPFRKLNGFLRGHPHDWPEEEGQGRSLLDFGCHDGEKLARWYQEGWEVAGVDLNEPAISVAKKRFPEGRFWCGDLLELDIPYRFDVIRL